MATVLDDPITRVLAAFPGARQVSEAQWEACCPAHADSKPSLSIAVGDDGRALLHCHGGCELDAVLTAAGLTMTDLYRQHLAVVPEAPKTAYRYTDEVGELLFEVIRTVDKVFWQQSPDGDGGMQRSVKGVRRPLYRLPEVIAAVANGETVWIAEGEKDVDRLVACGVTATCNPGGAGKWDLVRDAALVLAGTNVIILADKDEPGIAHARHVALTLQAAGCSTRLLQARTGKDVSDHLDASLSLDDLEALDPAPTDDATTDPAFTFTTGGTFVLDIPEGVPAVWGDGDEVLWSTGEPMIIAGPPGVGKSSIVSNVLFAMLGLDTGALGFSVAPATRVLYLACDRPAQLARLQNRLFTPADRAVLDDRLVVWTGPPPGDVAKNPRLLLDMAQAAQADTIIIDSLKDIAMKLSDDDVGAAVNLAMQQCVANGVQVGALHHTRKASATGGQPKSLDDIYGSRWLTAGAGSVIVVWGNAGDPVVELLHRKQPASLVGPLKVEHEPVTGRCTIVARFDPIAALRAAGPNGVDATQFARMTDGREPSDADRKRAKRALDRLVEAGEATVMRAARGGSGGTVGSRYRSAEMHAPGVTDAVSDGTDEDWCIGHHRPDNA